MEFSSTSDILNVDPDSGLKRSFIYYLETLDIIHPKVDNKGNYKKRQYCKEDVEKINKTWKYVKEGMTPKKAHNKVLEEEKAGSDKSTVDEGYPKKSFTAFLLIQSELGKVYQVFDKLQQSEEIEEIAVIFGEWDIIIRLAVDDIASLNSFLTNRNSIAKLREVRKSRTYIAINPNDSSICWSEPDRHQGIDCQADDDTVAYIFVETKGDGANLIRKTLRDNKEVISAVSVYGEANIVAKVAVKKGLKRLNDFIDQTFINHHVVLRTNTFPVLDLQKGYKPLEGRTIKEK